jgi:Fur family zinc uptake transcriptional regulator
MSSPFPPPRHDHAPCRREALQAAEAAARAQGLRLTPLRRAVLEIVAESHRPMGAYDILNKLAEAEAARRPAPPTIYRALDFLRGAGFVHRIDTLNAYMACFAPGHRHRSHFLLCRACGCAAEIEHGGLDAALAEAAKVAGFSAERETVEIAGLCAACAQQHAGSSNAAPSP